jgi:UDP-glucose 4-epimerase
MAGAEAVVHLAASGSVLESVADPLTNFEHNAAGTLMTLEAARAQGKVDRFIFASTGGALIGNAPPPVHEGSLPRPISPYGASKLCGEAYCCAFAAAYGLHTVALRFANIYGPYSAHKRGAVTAFAKALMLDLPIVIYGSGQASRDFLHVDDLCTGIVSALLHDIPKGAALHLASGKETSIAELAKAMSAVAGKPEHPIEFRPERAGEVERNFGDFSLAKRLLGFEPSVPLQRGLQQTWAWFNEHGTWRD